MKTFNMSASAGTNARYFCCVMWIIGAFAVLADSCIVTAPNVVRLGAEETVVVFNRGSSKDVRLLVQDYPGRLKTLFTQKVSLGPDESRIVPMRIDPEHVDTEDVQSGQRKYLSLIAECGNIYKKEARLLISDKSGYLLLQTDKPIYTPKQTVHIRMVIVGEDLMPSSGKLKLEIKNPQNIVTYKATLDREANFSETGMFSDSYTFPGSPILGEWKAVATYGTHFRQQSEVIFQLDEYVLPTFSVTLTLPNVILTEQDVVYGSVEAKYVYGKAVEGSATFRFKVRNEAGEDQEVGSTTYKELVDGKAQFSISTESFKMPRRKRWSPMVQGNRLVVEADVLDRATSKREYTVDDSAIFATSPYLVTFKHTPKDFKPGVGTMVVAEIKHVNGKPAPGVPAEIAVLDNREQSVRVDVDTATADSSGRVAFSLQTKRYQTALKVKVQTKDPAYKSHQQADGSVVLSPFISPGEGFVSLKRIDIRTAFKVGEYFDGIVRTEPVDLSPVHYMVISRGHTKAHKTLNHSGLGYKSLQFQVTRDMSPNIRVLVYAFHNGHLLADSLAIEIEEVCTQSSEVEIETHFRDQEPGAEGSLKVRGSPGARVGILGVDKAVYILNNKELLTRSKLFAALKSHDIGCGPGGGVTSDDVIANAGVVVISQEVVENIIRTENSCESRVRKRRSILRRAVERYTDPFLKQCCALAQKRDRMGRSCMRRANIIHEYMPGEKGRQCADAFMSCCYHDPDGQVAFSLRPGVFGQDTDETDRGRFGVEVSSEDDIDEGSDGNHVQVRRDFRETWIFDEKTVGENGVAEFELSIPHSITTWSVQAVSVSPSGGVCVPETKEVRAFQDIFLQVSLPYKVVRNEQIEVLVTVYNYGAVPLRANIYIYGVEGLCSGAAPGQRSERKPVQVAANSATSVTFPVIPLREGEFIIKAHVKSSRGEDIVERVLNVVPEGVTVEKSVSVPIDPTNERRRKTRSVRGDLYHDSLDPAAKVQVISVNTRLPPDAVPDTKYCSLSLIGNKLGPSVQTTLENLESLITMPTGCGEQNMMLMAPTLYAVEYLKHKGLLNETLEEKAYSYIREGYERELSFRKSDGSFAAFKHRPSSVWLTAFVMRVFCKARQYTPVDPRVVESGMLYLAAEQELDGSFTERKPIMHKTMLGGVQGAVPMTAFVLLTFYECGQSIGPGHEILKKTAARAENYLDSKVNGITQPYVAALAAYALSLGNHSNKGVALEILKDQLLYDHMLNTRSTGEEPTPLVVEGTSYALLALLEHNDVESSSSIVNWLNTHRSASGSFASTQDTIVALQALTEFAYKSRDSYLDLMCNVTLSNQRHFKKSIRLKRENAAVLHQLDIHDISGKMFLSASGTGSGLLSVKLKYNVLVPPEALCKFNITVRADVHRYKRKSVKSLFPDGLLGELTGERQRRAVWYLSTGDSRYGSIADRGSSPASPFFPDPRNREATLTSREVGRGSDGKQQQSKLVYDIEVCTRYLGESDSNMAVVEVGIFSGFSPVEEDLKELTGSNPLLAKYEITEKNVVLYFDKIPADVQTCVKFRAERDYIVHNVQSAVVKVYDYYNPMHSCTQFYGPGSTSPLLKLVCEGDQCQCAEAQCPNKEPFYDVLKAGPTFKQREKLAAVTCDQHDFAWRGQVFSNQVSNGFRNVMFRVDTVIKEGAENTTSVMSNTKALIARELCNMADLIIGKRYYILGRDSEPFEKDGKILMRYTMDQNVRIFQADDNASAGTARKLNSLFQWLSSGFVKRGGCSV